MNWFAAYFGVEEKKLIAEKEKYISIVNPNFNIFKIGDSVYNAGRFDTLTVEDLRKILNSIKNKETDYSAEQFIYGEPKILAKKPAARPVDEGEEETKAETIKEKEAEPKEDKLDPNAPSRLTFKHLTNADIRFIVLNSKSAGSVFQLASQFNCLEMIGPSITPEKGINDYILDQTQGPISSLCCPGALFYRNYLWDRTGQSSAKQINLLADVDKYLQNDKFHYWKIKNGYCLTDDMKKACDLNEKIKGKELEIEKRIKVGIHWDTEVDNIHKKGEKKHNVCQVFCSTMALQYEKDKKDQKKIWGQFCKLLLKGTYQATLTVAAILARLQQKRISVYLTAVGGGVFGNPKEWIAEAIQAAIDDHIEEPLDVYLVNYSGTVPINFSKIGASYKAFDSKIKENK